MSITQATSVLIERGQVPNPRGPASLLIRHGESAKTVQNRLGHASAVEALDT